MEVVVEEDDDDKDAVDFSDFSCDKRDGGFPALAAATAAALM